MQVTQPLDAFDVEKMMDAIRTRPTKPLNTRTRKTALKELRRLSNAPKSIQKRVLKRR